MQFAANQIAAVLGGKVIGDGNRQVSNVAPVETAKEGDLSFVTEAKYLPCLETTQASIVLVTESLTAEPYSSTPLHPTLILVENARGAMGQLLTLVEKAMNPARQGIEQPCFVSEGVSVPEDAYIGAFAYIGKNVKLGKGVQIYPQVYLGDNVVVGDNTILYAGVRIYHDCKVGANCILHAGAVIGADGFGFEPDSKGVNQKIPQIGNVVIEDDVEIGANATIDRAMMGSTTVHTNAKIDNLVVIAHNVQIGASTFMCGQSGVAGSTTIGSHCILAGQVGVAGHINIADGTIFGAQTGVPKSITKGGYYEGSPAIDAAQWRRAVVGFKQLPDILKRLQALENKVESEK